MFPIIKDQFPTFPNQFKKRSWSIYKWSMFHSYVSLLQLFSSVPYGTNPFVLRGRAQLCTSLDSSRFSRPRQGTRLRLKAEETVFFLVGSMKAISTCSVFVSSFSAVWVVFSCLNYAGLVEIPTAYHEMYLSILININIYIYIIYIIYYIYIYYIYILYIYILYVT